MATGARDTSLLALPVGWDAAVLERERLSDGTTFLQVAAALNGAVQAAAQTMYANPLWASLVSYTNEPAVMEYAQGAANGFKEFTEYGRADPQRADTTGHMLPIKPYDRALAWTWYYLRNARMAQIEADIADAVKDMGDLWRKAILRRVLRRIDDSGAAMGLGTGGYSPGLATDAGSTAVDFVPPAHGGVTFTSAHEHYVAIAGGAFTADVFKDIKAELLEHGHLPPYDCIIGTLDEATVRGLTGFIPVQQVDVNYATTVSLATFGAEYRDDGYNIGTINDVRVRVINGMPRYYGFGWKSYGANSQRNPFRIRLAKNTVRPTFEVMTDPTAGNATQPLQYAMIFTEFGVGVGSDRTNGTARYVNNSTWADGTAT